MGDSSDQRVLARDLPHHLSLTPPVRLCRDDQSTLPRFLSINASSTQQQSAAPLELYADFGSFLSSSPSSHLIVFVTSAVRSTLHQPRVRRRSTCSSRPLQPPPRRDCRVPTVYSLLPAVRSVTHHSLALSAPCSNSPAKSLKPRKPNPNTLRASSIPHIQRFQRQPPSPSLPITTHPGVPPTLLLPQPAPDPHRPRTSIHNHACPPHATSNVQHPDPPQRGVRGAASRSSHEPPALNRASTPRGFAAPHARNRARSADLVRVGAVSRHGRGRAREVDEWL